TGDNLQGPPSLGADGTVYVQSASSDVYAVRAFDGAVLWHFAAATGSVGSRATPALSADGSTLYVGSSGGCALRPHHRWEAAVADAHQRSHWRTHRERAGCGSRRDDLRGHRWELRECPRRHRRLQPERCPQVALHG